jgi:Na+/H+ antiporter NhaC
MIQKENVSEEEGKNETIVLERTRMNMKSILISIIFTVVIYLTHKISDNL